MATMRIRNGITGSPRSCSAGLATSGRCHAAQTAPMISEAPAARVEPDARQECPAPGGLLGEQEQAGAVAEVDQRRRQRHQPPHRHVAAGARHQRSAADSDHHRQAERPGRSRWALATEQPVAEVSQSRPPADTEDRQRQCWADAPQRESWQVPPRSGHGPGRSGRARSSTGRRRPRGPDTPAAATLVPGPTGRRDQLESPRPNPARLIARPRRRVPRGGATP